MWIFTVNTVSKMYPSFPMKMNFWFKGWGFGGARLKRPNPNPSLIIHIRRLTTVFFSKLYIILPCRGKTYPSHVIGKGVCRTYANKIAMNDKIMKKVAGTEKEGKKYMTNVQHLVVLGVHPSRHYPDWHCLTSLRRPDFFGTHNHWYEWQSNKEKKVCNK